MQIYKAPIQDMMFQLTAFGYDKHVQSLEAFAAYDTATAAELLKSAGRFVTEVLLPINRSGDQQGLKWDPKTGAVTTPAGFREAYAQFTGNGFGGLCAAVDFGGSGAPISIGMFMSEMWTSGNKSFSMCPGLTSGLIEALEAHASDEIKQAFLPKLVSGEWTGTMCLTEPQCGTDLGLVRTKAIPAGDHYKLTGTKIWITFGEHDYTENIVHFVLARLPDAPEGIKGISVFLVPKITRDGKRNHVRCTGLEHKLGIHASPTCVIDMEDAVGYLVGEPHRGMRSMFTMMNTARLLVGVEGVALSEIAYQTALEFAKDRRQSRSLDPAKQDKSAAADNIMVHPDVRRMLLNVKCTLEGLRGLAAWASIELDIAHNHSDATVREEADDLAQLLTPIIKSYGTERGFLNVSEAMQVCGGAGYTRDWSIEQYLRDVRIAMLYEGTNHIQALDLVGRKLPRHGGRMFQRYCKRVGAFVAEHKDNQAMAEFVSATQASLTQLVDVTTKLAAKGMADAEEAGAGASHYLNLFALNALAYTWCVQVAHALSQGDDAHARTKLKTARYFFERVLPERLALEQYIAAGKATMMSFEVEEF